MNDYQPTRSCETIPADPESGATSRDWPVSASMVGQAREPRAARSLSRMRRGLIVVAALIGSVSGLFVGLGASTSASAAQSAASSSSLGGGQSSGGSNARSGPAAGGAIGIVGNISKSSFTLTTSAGQEVTVNEVSSTKYKKGTNSISVNAVKKGDNVLVLGTTDGTKIVASQVIVKSTGGGGSTAASAAQVVPFQRGAPTTSKHVGDIPANWNQGSGTIVSGTAANKATESALAAYPGGIVDRVVKLSNGEYNVHFIGVNWPHHVFVNKNFKVVGAE
jgi:hypothetical protein